MHSLLRIACCAAPIGLAASLSADSTAGTGTSQAQSFVEWWSLPFGDERLVLPGGIHVTPQCVVWIADLDVPRWTCDGRFLGKAARTGLGPGEFQWPWSVGNWRGDSVGVYDRRRNLVALFDGEGKFGRAYTIQLSESRHGRLSGITPLGDGTLVWTDNYPTSGRRPNEQDSYVWRADGQGRIGDSVAVFQGPESYVARDNRSVSRLDLPFQRRPSVFFDSSGKILIANSGLSTIVVLDIRGVVVDTIRLALPPARRATARDRTQWSDSARQGFLAEIRTQQLGPSLVAFFEEKIERMIRTISFSTTFPRYERIARDRSGQFWVQLVAASSSYTRVWEVYSPAGGARLRRASVPHRANVAWAAVQNDVIFAAEVNRNGLWRMVAYRAR
jgi:hypothetical protein